jgi:DNA repair protein RadC
LARRLLDRFGGLQNVLAASYDELIAVPGVGKHAATLIVLVARLTGRVQGHAKPAPEAVDQPALFQAEPDLGPLFHGPREPDKPEMHAFVNDEIANSLAFVPQAAQFGSFEAFKAYLEERLPYNSHTTRDRRADDILARFFPGGRLDVPLTYYAAHCGSPQDLKPALFYHVLRAEPLAARVAEELLWPALPVGYVGREAIREFVLRCVPNIGVSSQNNTLRSLFMAYDLLSVGVRDESTLRFQIHAATLEAFLYVLTAELPEPGMYAFDALEEGPMRHWLLWDREWMRRQLYNLRDMGVLSRVSEIDTVRQFTLQLDQWAALRRYFEHPDRGKLALREEPTGEPSGGEVAGQ